MEILVGLCAWTIPPSDQLDASQCVLVDFWMMNLASSCDPSQFDVSHHLMHPFPHALVACHDLVHHYLWISSGDVFCVGGMTDYGNDVSAEVVHQKLIWYVNFD